MYCCKVIKLILVSMRINLHGGMVGLEKYLFKKGWTEHVLQLSGGLCFQATMLFIFKHLIRIMIQ